MTDNNEITRAEWDALSADQWVAMIRTAWSRPLIPLTDVVHWIATAGVPREPDFEELTEAARVLVETLRSSKIVAFGIPADGEMHKQIPTADILSATANGAEFFDDLNLFIFPALHWAHDPGENNDTILGMTRLMWKQVSVERTAMISLWPEKNAPSSSAESARHASVDSGQRVRRGRPPAVDWTMVSAEVLRLMDHHGEFADHDSDWNSQARLEETIANYIEKTFSKSVEKSAVRSHIRTPLAEWRAGR